MLTIIVMCLFGMILGSFPMVVLFEALYAFKGRGGQRPVVESPFLFSLGVGFFLAIALLALLVVLLAGETQVVFLTMSPYALAGFETSAYWVALFYAKRGRPLKGKWSAKPAEDK